MDTSGQEKQSIASPLCANACGFYGNPTTRNLCSKCYHNALRIEQADNLKQPDIKSSPHTNNDVNRQSDPTQVELTIHANNLNEESFQTEQRSAVDLIYIPQSKLVISDVSKDPKPIESSINQYNEINHTHSKTQSNYNGIGWSDQLDNSRTESIITPAPSINETCQEISKITVQNSSTSLNSTSVKIDNSSANDGVILDVIKDTQKPSPPIQVNKTRCYKCQKRIGLLGFQCRCDFYFCGAHRHADCHDCPFDYKSFGRQQLSKTNRRVVAEKLNRI